jgi:hypothetical protein
VIFFISEDAHSECFIQFYGVPRQCPCTPIILATRDEAVGAAQAECGGTTYYNSGYNSGNCYGVDDLRVGAMCSRRLPDPDPEKHCWSTPIPPKMGGCCAQGNCYYYIPEPEECCPEDEQQGACCEGKKCPANEVGNPINVLTGNNRSSETDLFFSNVTMTYDTGAGANLFGRLASEAPGAALFGIDWVFIFSGYALRSSETGRHGCSKADIITIFRPLASINPELQDP